jgi:hypothetical protein
VSIRRRENAKKKYRAFENWMTRFMRSFSN